MSAARKPLYRSLYFQVIVAIVIGVLLGHFYPETGTAMTWKYSDRYSGLRAASI